MVSIFAGVNGYLDGIAVGDVTRFETQLLDEIRDTGGDILNAIRSEKQISEETDSKLKAFLGNFVQNFV